MEQIFCMKLAFQCHSLANKFYRDRGKHQLLPSSVLRIYSPVVNKHRRLLAFLKQTLRNNAGQHASSRKAACKAILASPSSTAACCFDRPAAAQRAAQDLPQSLKKTTKLLNACVHLGEMLSRLADWFVTRYLSLDC